jgi:hypothetical protein
MKFTRSLGACVALTHLVAAYAAAAPAPATGLADSAALRATVYGTPPEDIAPLPARVPLEEIDIALPWARPLAPVLWFDRRLRVWFSAQRGPAPLAIVISGTGADGNTTNISVLRAALYGAGYHVLTIPSPTFPGFVAAASSTGVAGDLEQDSRDVYAVAREIVRRLRPKVRITEVDILGYSLGGAHAAVVKWLDATQHELDIRRAVMINPPVSLFDSMERLDRLFASSIGEGDEGFDQLYRRVYVRLANYYRATDQVRVEDTNLMGAAAAVLRTDADFSAAIALTFRIALVNVFYTGDLYAGTGVISDPRHPPRPGDATEAVFRELLGKDFSHYFDEVFAPYYLARRPGITREVLYASSRLDLVGAALQSDPDYYAQTNADDLILDQVELEWLRARLGSRIVVYPHGGHLGNLGERQQIADMLDMLGGHWAGASR